MKVYRIKPLDWVFTWTDEYIRHKARTPFAVFIVYCEKKNGEPTGKWVWTYFFHATVEDEGSCTSPEEGKAICEKAWVSRMKKALEEVSHEGS